MTPQSMEDILNMSIEDVVPGTGAAVKVLKTGYDLLTSHRNLRTYSTTEVFHACPRKFAIQKMQAHLNTRQRVNNPTFAFGHSVGAGVATYDETGNMDQAIFQAMLAWDIDLFADEYKPGKRRGKSFHEAIWAVKLYASFKEEELSHLADYEVLGNEMTVAIDFEDGSFYSGHIDTLLKHKHTGQLLVKENKTTGFGTINPALYSNSDQALSYSVVVDANHGGSEYGVLYTTYSATEQRWIHFEFIKQTYKRADWLQDQLLINQTVDSYAELCFFPKRGHSCFAFMRPCEYYETCDISFGSAFGMEYAELPVINSLDDIDAIEKVDFRAKLSDIVSRQKELIASGRDTGKPSQTFQPTEDFI